MKNNQHHRTGRKPALSSIGLAVIATLIASGAQAADTSYDFGASPAVIANSHQTLNVLQGNSNAINAAIANSIAGVETAGVQNTVTNTVSNNLLEASAIGSLAQPFIALDLVMDSAGQGAAALLHSTNSGNVSSLVDQSSVLIDVTNFQSGSAANINNTISARTAANQGTSSIVGSVPNGYTSGTPGSASIATSGGTTTSAAEGTLVVTTAQESKGATSSALVVGNDVTLNLTADNTPYKVASGAALTDNTVSASTKGNSSANTINIQAGTAPSFTGSAVVSNTQLGVNTPALAGNNGNAITATVTGNDLTNAAEMGGTLAVTGNRISSAAIGNEALGNGPSAVGNRILLADSLAFMGGGAATPGANLQGYAAGTAVDADLLIANTQSNQTVGAPVLVGSVRGETIGGVVRANVDSLVNGTVNLSANSISSSATGNAASSAIASGKDSASFASSIALANQQDNNRVGVVAVNTNSVIEATVGAVTDNRAAAGDVQTSSVSVNNNRSTADARGNEVGQNLSLNATTLALGGTNDNVKLDSASGLLEARGTATVSNRQVNDNAPVLAENNASSIGQRAGTLTGPMLMVNGNAQNALALGNNATNQVALTGNTVGSGAGILSLQRTEAGGDTSTVASSVTASLSGARAFIEAGKDNAGVTDGVTGSTLKLTNNKQNALGYGNLADNAMVATGNTLAAPATSGPASSVSLNFGSAKPLSGTVVAAYGVLNDQAVLADVSALAVSTGASADVLVTGRLRNSSVLNDANTLASAAYGNSGQNSLTLNPGNVDSTGASSVGNVTSLQTVAANITAQAAAKTVALTTITGSVGAPGAGSSVSTSGNRLDAQAIGSFAANALDVNATNIATDAAGSPGADVGSSGTLNTNASFSVQNAQLGGGSVTATLRDSANPLFPSDVRIDIGGNVRRSSVVADSNVARVSATSNNASNTLVVNADSNLASSSALQNGQLTNANVNALIGAAGVTGTPSTPYSFNATPLNQDASGASVSGSTSQSGAGTPGDPFTYIYSGYVRTMDSAAANVAGWTQGTVVGTNDQYYYRLLTAESTGTANPTVFAPINYSGTNGGTDAVAQLGGVSLAVGGNIIRSTLSVDGNSSYGVVKGNEATNSASVKGSMVEAGSNSAVARANDVLAGNTQQQVVADHSLSNLQVVGVLGSSNLQSNVYGNFVIDGQPSATISNSSLSVSGNQQMAESRANIASNTLALEGTAGLQSVSALQSVQLSGAAVSALSNMQLSAPSSIIDSTLNLSDNRNIALAVINDATNTLTAKGSNVGTNQVASISIGGISGTSVTAEHLLANQQQSTTNVSSTALTSLANQEYVANGNRTGNVIGSTLSILNNVTAAEATANTAFNTVDVTGAASQTASAALRNLQNSSSDATASATSIAGIALPATGATVALNSSSVLLNGNSTTVLARGNNATNVLNSLAGSAYGVASNGSVVSNGTNLAVSANAGILNSQNNSGAVLATVADTYSVVAMNSVGSPAITGSSVSVTGNQVAAQAYGNSVVNQVTLNALNTGSPTSAVGSYQSNSGAVTAVVDTVFFGAGTLVSGGVTGSTLRVNGNQITASAIGNSSVSSILAR